MWVSVRDEYCLSLYLDSFEIYIKLILLVFFFSVNFPGEEEILLDDILTLFIAGKKLCVLLEVHLQSKIIFPIIILKCNIFLIPGQETTANTTSFMLMEIGRHPEIMKKLADIFIFI